MRVLLTGASGFIGRHLLVDLPRAGHAIVYAGRNPNSAPPGMEFVPIDFTRDFDAQVWQPKLRGIDVVINAVGILREEGSCTFDAVHVRAPRALFDACVAARVPRVIQISALGADADAQTGYHLSKRCADEYLRSLPINWTIVQPSVIYGPDGRSARLFTALASLPLIPLPGGGDQVIQPIHIEDVVAGLRTLVDSDCGCRAVIPFVGPTPLALRDYLATLRRSMDLSRPRFIEVPIGLVRATATLAERVPGTLLTRESLEMLFRGNTGDELPLRRLLGRPATPTQQFISRAEATRERVSAQLNWLIPLLRLSVALVWIFTGVVSLGLYPAESSYVLLARVGVSGPFAAVLLYGAATMDLALGIATVLVSRRRLLWLLQIAIIVVYTVIISLRLPELWLHPFGPLIKNVPMLAMIVALYCLERR